MGALAVVQAGRPEPISFTPVRVRLRRDALEGGSSSNRLCANGSQIAREEDVASVRSINSGRKKWASF